MKYVRLILSAINAMVAAHMFFLFYLGKKIKFDCVACPRNLPQLSFRVIEYDVLFD